MKILHTADLHLGRQFNGMSLENDHQEILSQIVDAITKYRPEVFIIAGDIFDRASPPNSAVKQFNAFLTRVANETAAAVVMIAGNHDSGDRIGSMSIMTDATRALIQGPIEVDASPLVLKDVHGTVAFSALPFAYEYAARECFGDEAIATPEDVLNAQISAARAQLPEGSRWVVVAHAFVAGATGSESERPLARVGGIETVHTKLFEGAHYVALGHIHRPQFVELEHIRYAGAPLAFGFDETGESKSMSFIDLDADGIATISTIPFVPLRRVQVLRGKLAELVLAEPSSDFVKAVLTDEVPLIDPMKRLREVFPNACQLTYARDEQTPEAKHVLREQIEINNPVQVTGDFLQYVREQRQSEEELALITSALHDLGIEEHVT
jgi:DNA repair protein SbcD/Mre11